MWKQLRHAAYYDFEWRRRLATYRHRFAISEFTREWTTRRWGIDCALLPPPVDVDFEERPKERLVLSVGRFSTLAHTKKQLEMMQTYRRLSAESLNGWTYASVGGLNAQTENHAYFEQVRQAGRDASAIVEANLDRSRVKNLFERARIFWHATGLGEDPESRPELLEHFGIATVEAMAAGCVPVVINRGGQAEIVEHGVSGFVWNTLDELAAFTNTLASDEGLWQRMSAAARARAQQYSSDRFIERISRACNVAIDPARRLAAR
jgi:glycosyltransferase involved in cell wall biosynthesis